MMCIVYVNEMVNVCEVYDIDLYEVCDVVVIKLFGYMLYSFGFGVGGYCIFVNLYYFLFNNEFLMF